MTTLYVLGVLVVAGLLMFAGYSAATMRWRSVVDSLTELLAVEREKVDGLVEAQRLGAWARGQIMEAANGEVPRSDTGGRHGVRSSLRRSFVVDGQAQHFAGDVYEDDGNRLGLGNNVDGDFNGGYRR